MICTINFSTYESNPCWEYQETLDIKDTKEEINDVYLNSHADLGDLPFNGEGFAPRLRSLSKYEAFLKELDKRKIQYEKIEPISFIF